MSYQHYFEPRALKEYLTALKWYKKRSYLAAPNFVKEVDAALIPSVPIHSVSGAATNNSGKYL